LDKNKHNRLQDSKMNWIPIHTWICKKKKSITKGNKSEKKKPFSFK
jgi:hypothetical protein